MMYCSVIPLAEIGDEVFSEGVPGKGCGIRPDEGCVYALFPGTVVSVADTKHALGLASEDGVELLIHAGIDTVALKGGEGFRPLVKEGDSIACGQKLLEFDKEAVAQKYPTVTAVIVTNSDDYETVSMGDAGPVGLSDTVLKAE